jgi:hypothetical protein
MDARSGHGRLAGPFAEPAGGKWAIAEIAARHLAPALEKMADP